MLLPKTTGLAGQTSWMPCPIPVGARLARDAIDSVSQILRVAFIAGKPCSHRVIHKPLEILAQPQGVVDGRVGITLGHAVADAEQQVAVAALLQARLGLDREQGFNVDLALVARTCLLYTSPSPRDRQKSRMPSSA